MSYVTIKPMGLMAQNANRLMYPLMRMLMEMNGAWEESPQRTHRWNNHRLSKAEANLLYQSHMAYTVGDPDAWYLASGLRHMPVIGWQRYVVLSPKNPSEGWHVGWLEVGGGVSGVSKLRLTTAVKLLRGPRDVYFYATDENGRQMPISKIGEGKLFVHKGPWSDLPLL